MKVNFLIAGVQKAGTSALDAYLREHPQITMAQRKEVHFFDNENHFARYSANDTPDYAPYHAAFDAALDETDTKLYGEATPIYSYWQPVMARIWQYNPQIKLIVLLRNPIERAYSHWNMETRRDWDKVSFWQALQTEQQRCREALPLQHRVYSYLERGFYSEQLRRMWRFFPKAHTLVLKSEDLKHQPQTTLNRICDFLACECLTITQAKYKHVLPYPQAMTKREYDYLRDHYRLEIQQLEQMLNWDCQAWLNAPQ